MGSKAGLIRELWQPADSEAHIGRLLGVARRARGLSQVDLAQRLDVSNANISRIEHGSDPRLSTLNELARELKLELLLVPKEYLAAVRAYLDALSSGSEESDAPAQRPRFG